MNELSPSRSTQRARHFDVVVVGAGPAGLAAAVAAAGESASVLVIDAGEQPGGQFWRHRSEAASVEDNGDLHHSWRSYLALRSGFDQHIAQGTMTYLPFTSVWMARTRKHGFTVNLTSSVSTWTPQLVAAHATTLVLATGGYDRQLPVPGWELPGVMTAGGIQAFAKQNGSLPGTRFVVAGTGPFLLPVADNIVSLGGSVAAVCESANLLGWLPRAHRAAGVPSKALEGAGYATTFIKHRIPYRLRTIVTEVLGTDQVEAVRTAKIRRNGDVIASSERIIEGVDGVGLGWGFTPQMELPVSLGVNTRIDTDGSLVATVDPSQHSTVPGVFLAGEVTGVGGSVLAVLEGTVAGRAAGSLSQGRDHEHPTGPERRSIQRQRSFADAMHLAHPVPAGWQQHLTADTVVCRCEEVTAGQIAEALEHADAHDARTQKGITRAGMGWCQGRVCGFAVSCLSSVDLTASKASLENVNKRPVSQPLPLGELSMLGDDTAV